MSEHNPEHQVAASREPVGNIMDAAGYLCALQLLAGIEGFGLSSVSDSPSFEPLNRLGNGSGLPLGVLKQALATRLFTEGATGFRPHHRHIAEFLAGCYLAKLVDHGLPARRVTALMASPSDGRVVTELRGLSAWMAAYPGEARSLLIDADPVGVGLYGDIGAFSKDDKSRLLTSLTTFAEESALFGHGLSDRGGSGFRDRTTQAFRSLASADMASEIEDLIGADGSGAGDRIVEFVLVVLSEAADAPMEPLAHLSTRLEAIIRDATRSLRVTRPALDAYFHIAPLGPSKTRFLTKLLRSLHQRELPDPNDELRGTLLDYLYPEELTPAKLWQYASLRNCDHFYGRFWMFWNRRLLENSSRHQVAELLDAMTERDWPSVEVLEMTGLDDVPMTVLAQGLETMGDDIELSRLYSWLSVEGLSTSHHTLVEGSKRVRLWLEARPDIQKQVFMEWMREKPEDEPLLYRDPFKDPLHASRLPSDFGRWCLEEAVAHDEIEPTVARLLLESAYGSLHNPIVSERLTTQVIEDRIRSRPTLEKCFADLKKVRQAAGHSNHPARRRGLQTISDYQREVAQRRQDWERHLRLHYTEPRSKTLSPQNLKILASVYLGEMPGTRGVPPRTRIADFIGGDPKLVDKVMASLCGAVRRTDLPSVEETISQHSQSRLPWLAFPVLASMDLLPDDSESMLRIDELNRKSALALYYCFPVVYRYQDESRIKLCHDAWLKQDPGLVTGVLYKCAAAALRDGADSLPGVNDLDGIERRHDVAQGTRLRLLEAFPTRIPSRQLKPFDELLKPALTHSDRSPLMKLAAKKLAKESLSVPHRIRWMTVGALISGGKRAERLRVYVGANERRTRHLAEFLHNTRDHPNRTWIGLDSAGSELVTCLIELLGRSYGPQHPDGLVTVDVSTSDLVSRLISRLGSMADSLSVARLASLVDNPLLAHWRERLRWAQEQQRVLHRDTSYSHPDIEDVQRALNGGTPANVADLAALLSDRLKDIRHQIRGDSGNPWRQFWNVDSYGRPTDARPEESCRDVLLELLKARLPAQVDVAPEGRYATGKRADIRVSHGGYSVPIEIKKNGDRDLWSALQRQLIGQYTTDPATSGYGIYLVLWFGPDQTKPPPDGPRPANPEELQRMLEKDLTSEEARKISVIVMDVTRP